MITPEGAALQAMNQSNSTQQRPRNRRFLDENQLIEDAFRLGVQVFESGFRPNFIVGLWRGGSTVARHRYWRRLFWPRQAYSRI